MEDISSWGIGMPSYVNPKTNLLVHANCFGWKNVPIYDYLKKHISLPTYIANDANCATYGEVLAGSASQYTDAIMLTLGTGVGGGIIMGKRIYSGADNMGAELGHTNFAAKTKIKSMEKSFSRPLNKGIPSLNRSSMTISVNWPPESPRS